MASDSIGNGDGGVDGRNSPTEREVPPSLPPLVPQSISTDSSLTEDISRKRDPNSFENEGPKRCLCKHSKCLKLKTSRKRDPNTFENEDPKSCLCKHSKCLKLYCQCFLNGEYCAEGCGCQDCYNTPDHEDMVLGVREKIKSTNPSAFIRKIMKYATESHQNSGSEVDNR